MDIKPSIPTIEYLDYRNFINYLDDKYSHSINNINPYEFFKIGHGAINPRTLSSFEFIASLFKGRYRKLPDYDISTSLYNKYKRFEDFTHVDEVRNLSMWTLSCMKELSFGKTVKLGKELEIIQENNPRNGRLDVVAMHDDQMVIFEAKTSLASLLSEGRYKYQIPGYLTECSRVLESRALSASPNCNLDVYLLIGGEETDLYPSDHQDCITGKVGDISNIFYDSLVEYSIRFISANALWSLSAYSEVSGEKIYWFKVLPYIFSDKSVIGLLSGGIVRYENGKFTVYPIDDLIHI